MLESVLPHESAVPPSSASPNVFPEWLRDRVATWVLRYEIAGMITRSDAQRISQYADRDAAKVELNETIERHRVVHSTLKLVTLPLLSETVNDQELRSAHDRFLGTLRALSQPVSAAFSRGEITLPIALWLHTRQADARDIQALIENGWKTNLQHMTKLPSASSGAHPHSSGGIAFMT